MANSNVVGYVVCPFSLERSPVKINKNERLYYSNPATGPVIAHGDAMQDWIQDNMEPVPGHDAPAANDPEPPAEPEAEPEPERKRRARPWEIDDGEL